MIRNAVAIFVGLIGAGLAVFGVMRGLQTTGPASGVRMIVEVAPPLDAESFALAEKVVRDRLADNRAETLVVPANGQIIVEVSAFADETAALLERPATLAGAAHPMHVVHREPFSRAVGFFPRAWPFLAAGGVLVLAAVAVAFLRGPRKPAKS